METIAEHIERGYDEADNVGSLVVDGKTVRPTEHDGPKIEPPGWQEPLAGHAPKAWRSRLALIRNASLGHMQFTGDLITIRKRLSQAIFETAPFGFWSY